MVAFWKRSFLLFTKGPDFVSLFKLQLTNGQLKKTLLRSAGLTSLAPPAFDAPAQSDAAAAHSKYQHIIQYEVVKYGKTFKFIEILIG